MIYSLESISINSTYEFDDFIHDRSIQTVHGCKILLERGLDIWQKTGGYADITDYIQERKLCKACEITFLKSEVRHQKGNCLNMTSEIKGYLLLFIGICCLIYVLRRFLKK